MVLVWIGVALAQLAGPTGMEPAPCPPSKRADVVFEGRPVAVVPQYGYREVVYDVAAWWRGSETVIEHRAAPHPDHGGQALITVQELNWSFPGLVPTLSEGSGVPVPPQVPQRDRVVYAFRHGAQLWTSGPCRWEAEATSEAVVLVRERLGPPRWRRNPVSRRERRPAIRLQDAIAACALHRVALLRRAGTSLPGGAEDGHECLQANPEAFADAILAGGHDDPGLVGYVGLNEALTRRLLDAGVDLSGLGALPVASILPRIPEDRLARAFELGLGPSPRAWLWAMQHESPVLREWARQMPLTATEASELLLRKEALAEPQWVKILLARGAALEGARDRYPQPPIVLAALHGFSATVQLLWEAGSQPTYLLPYAVPELVDELPTLVSWGVDLEGRDHWQMTALGRAICYGGPEVVARVLELGPSLRTPTDRRDVPPIALALDRGRCYPRSRLRGADRASVERLLAAGLRVEEALPWVPDRGWVGWMRQRGARLLGPSGRDGLAFAAGENRSWFVEWLLAQGVDPHGATSDGWPVLAKAVAHWRRVDSSVLVRRFDGLRTLLAAGADPTALTPDGRTARSIALARRDDSHGLARLLSEQGFPKSEDPALR